jgi:hypothetical protein
MANATAVISNDGKPSWVVGDKLFLAGGKYSVMENGVPRFIYRNDVWSLARLPR